MAEQIVQLTLFDEEAPTCAPPERGALARRFACCLLVAWPGWRHVEVEQGTLWREADHPESQWVRVKAIKRVPATLGNLLKHRAFVANYLSRLRERRGKPAEMLAWMKELEQYCQRLEDEILRRQQAQDRIEAA